MTFSEDKCKVLGGKNPVQQYCLLCNCLEKNLVIFIGSKLYMSYLLCPGSKEVHSNLAVLTEA